MHVNNNVHVNENVYDIILSIICLKNKKIGYLLAGVRRQIEAKYGESVDGDTGDEEVDCVEECLASQRQVERDVHIRTFATWVKDKVFLGWHIHQVPLDAPMEFAEVDSQVNERHLIQAKPLLPDV